METMKLDETPIYKQITGNVPEDLQHRYFFFVDNADAELMIRSCGYHAQAISEELTIEQATDIMEQTHNKGLIEFYYIGCMDRSSNTKLKTFCEDNYCHYKDGWSIFYKKDYLKKIDKRADLAAALAEYIEQQEGIKLVKCDDGFYRQVDDPEIESDIKDTYNVADFIKLQLADQIADYRKGENIKTGFANLDQKAGSLHAGLYVVGAISSLGKTTFMHQIADQLAAQGQHVLFFSLEQSTLELVSKSLSRRTAQISYEGALTSLQIRYGNQDPLLDQAKAAYIADVGERLSIIEGNFSCNIAFIKDTVKAYIDQNKCKPVVIIDYLQILPAAEQARGRQLTDPKAIIDFNITELKKISRSLSVPVFVISSINRSNYLNTIDFSSFKESGAIEYTADVVWGLQLACITENELFKNESKLNEKRELIRKEKSKLPRDLQLVCLKNRYGISDYSVKFKYYPNYDLFIPADEWQPIKAAQTPFKPAPITI